MLYCEKCHLLCEEEKCEQCGNKNLKTVADDDFCLFAELGGFEADMLKGALEQNGIPCVSVPTKGTAMTMLVFFMTESYKVYVPYGKMAEVKEIHDDLFGENAQIAEEAPIDEFLDQDGVETLDED